MTTPIERLEALVGTSLGPSAWLLVDQARIDRFAEATDDHQWIHSDPVRAAQGPFGSTVAHGYLSLALLPTLVGGLLPVEGFAARMNYGSNKVRFPHPLPVDTRVRATSVVLDVTEHPLGVLLTQRVTVMGEGLPKPVCVAEAVSLLTR